MLVFQVKVMCHVHQASWFSSYAPSARNPSRVAPVFAAHMPYTYCITNVSCQAHLYAGSGDLNSDQ